MGNAGLQVSWSAEPFTARRRSLRRTRAVLISAMALGPVGRAYTPDWAARLRRRVKIFDGIVFTVMPDLRHSNANSGHRTC